MKKHHGKFYIVGDIAKKLGISFADLKSEFAECGISVRENDKVMGKTLEYVLSGMYDEEMHWGEHLHLETGEVAGEIHRGAMRGNEGDEIGYHDLRVSGWAHRLGIDKHILVNELRVHGYSVNEDDIVTVDQIREIISGAELHHAWDETQMHKHTDEYHATCLENDCGTIDVSNTALQLGVPATALMGWLAYSSKKGGKTTGASCSAKGGSCSVKNGHEVVYGKGDVEYIDNSEVAKASAYGNWVAGDEEEEIASGVVATGTPVHASSGKALHHGVARGLLGFLAIPLLAGLFLDSKNLKHEINQDGGAMVIHGAAEGDHDDKKADIMQDDARREDADVSDKVKAIMERPTSGAGKNLEASSAGVVTQSLDDAAPQQAKDFVSGLADDINNEKVHGVALPSSLPKTGGNL